MGTFVPIMSTILSAALFGKTQNAILGLLFTNVDEAYYLREIVRRTGMGQGAVQRELKKLSGARILLRQDIGRQSFYRANKDCPIYHELHGLAIKTAGLVEQIAAGLRPLDSTIKCAFLFGSFAEGRETKGSDIDLLIIGETSLRDVVGALGDIQQKLGREINPVVYRPKEFGQKSQSGSHFTRTLETATKIFIKGDLDVLSRLG